MIAFFGGMLKAMDDFKQIVQTTVDQVREGSTIDSTVDEVSAYFDSLMPYFKGSDTIKQVSRDAEKLLNELKSIKKKKDKDKKLVKGTVKLTARVVEDMFKEEHKRKEASKGLRLYDIEDFVRKSAKNAITDHISLKFRRREHEFVYLRRDSVNGYYLARVRWKNRKNRPMNIRLGHTVTLNAKDDRIVYITVPGRVVISLLADEGLVLGYEVLGIGDGESSE